MPVCPVDWDKIRSLMAKSIRGRELSPQDRAIIEHAWKYWPNTYSKIHSEEKQKAAEELNPLAGSRR